MIRLLMTLLIPLLLTACASTTVNQLGPDTYRVIGPSYDGASSLFAEGERFCKAKNRKILVTEYGSYVGNDYYAINIQCLKKNDPALVRPTYK